MPESSSGRVPPRTAAEASGYAATTLSADVSTFVDACVDAAPHRLRRTSLARSTEGREIPLVLAAEPPPPDAAAAGRDGRPVLLVMANIHAGEVEGKEAVLELLREIAFDGRHAELLRRTIVLFVPNYNPDGNDAVDRRQRPDQAGPILGVGRRPNGQGLDLNRDYLKVVAPETAGLLAAAAASGALLVVDCHATNGSFHGYDLTYAGPLHPATDPALLDFVRGNFLPAVRGRMAALGFATFDYGNWVDEKNPAFGWATFEPHPRFGNSYFGLRNRLTLLSEAYSHDPFAKRIASTKALILSGWREFAAQADEIRRLCAAADAHDAAGAPERLPTRGVLAYAGVEPVPVGGVREEKDEVTGLVRQWDNDLATPTPMPVYPHFDGADFRPVPAMGWAVRRPSPRLVEVLDRHGIAYRRLLAPEPVVVREFVVTKTTVAPRPFQEIRFTTYEGRDRVARTELPPGAIFVPSAQALRRLAFILLEPESEDGAGLWGFLGVDRADDGAEIFAALRVEAAAP
jgi:hypothetical protein